MLPRLRACAGGQNLAIFANKHLEKSELPSDLILREGGDGQGGRIAMVSAGLIYSGKGRLRSHPLVRRPTRRSTSKLRRTRDFQTASRCAANRQHASPSSGRSSSHTANAARDYSESNPPKFRMKNGRRIRQAWADQTSSPGGWGVCKHRRRKRN